MTTPLRFTVDVEFGVSGTVHHDQTFSADTTEELLTAIADAHNELIIEVERSADHHGDLRRYCPEYANGAPTYDGPEDVCIAVHNLRELKLTDITTPAVLNRMHRILETKVYG